MRLLKVVGIFLALGRFLLDAKCAVDKKAELLLIIFLQLSEDIEPLARIDCLNLGLTSTCTVFILQSTCSMVALNHHRASGEADAYRRFNGQVAAF